MPQHRHQRRDARSATDKERWVVSVPHEPATDRSAYLQRVAGMQGIVQVNGHLSVLEPVDQDLDLVPSPGAEQMLYEREAV
jgi:hypothetical protein